MKGLNILKIKTLKNIIKKHKLFSFIIQIVIYISDQILAYFFSQISECCVVFCPRNLLVKVYAGWQNVQQFNSFLKC